MKKRSLKHISMANRIFYVFNAVVWVMVMFIVMYPLYLVLISSISDPDAIALGKVIWRPVNISLVGYKAIFSNAELWMAYANSIYYTILGTSFGIVVTLLAAYALSSANLLGKGFINFFFVVPMFFSGGMIPTFLVMKELGLYNTRLILILMGCITVWNLMVARTYIQNTIPRELYEAAELDGASHFQYFFRVVLPLSKTIVSVLTVYYGVAKWNNYMNGLVYIKDRYKLPLQTVLREILATLRAGGNFDALVDDVAGMAMAEAMRVANASKYCVIIVSTIPAVALYIVLQKYFEKGVMIGSLKG